MLDLPTAADVADLCRLLTWDYVVEVLPAIAIEKEPAIAGLEELWRDEWGRLLALLVAQYRRLDLAEDGLGDAFEAAARTWPRDGVPHNPPAWLLTAARRRILDRLRAEAMAARKLPLLAVESDLQEEAQRVMADAGEVVRDARLRLVLLCAHPSLAPEAAAALTLRLVLGVSTADIARLFLVSTPTMAARLTRARKSLAHERFEVPRGAALEERVGLAADIAYLAFTAGYAPASGPDVVRSDLSGEAIRLVRVLRELLPEHTELDALLALVLLQHSRRDARVRDGELVLLGDQDRSRWHTDEIDEAIALLRPLTDAPAAPYLLQALIAAEHAIAAPRPTPTGPGSRTATASCEDLTGSPVVRLNRAVAVAEADGPLAGLRAARRPRPAGPPAPRRPRRAAPPRRPVRRGARRAGPGHRRLRQRPGAPPPRAAPLGSLSTARVCQGRLDTTSPELVDLAAIPDPDLVSLPALHPGDVGLGDPFRVTCESVEAVHLVRKDQVLVGCDNNLPNTGRNPVLADDSEFILVRVPGLRGGGGRH